MDIDEARWALHCIIVYANEVGQPKGQDLQQSDGADEVIYFATRFIPFVHRFSSISVCIEKIMKMFLYVRIQSHGDSS